MLKGALWVLAGLAAVAVVMLLLRGMLYVADTGTSLDIEADERSGPPLTEVFPPAADWPAADLAQIRQQALEDGAHAMVVLHEGRLVAEWGATDRVSNLHGARNGVFSLLVGIGQERGYVLPDTADWDAEALLAELERTSGMTVAEAFAAWLAGPLGMVDFDSTAVHLVPAVEDEPARWEIDLSARDTARIAQLVLDRGHWQGVAVVPESWIEASTRPRRKMFSGLRGGYAGFGWRVPVSGEIETVGRGGQRIGIDTRLGLVIVTRVFTGGDPSEQAVWSVMGGEVSRNEYRRLKGQLEDAAGIGMLDPRFAELVDAGDVPAALAHVEAERARDLQVFLFTEDQLNDLGYELLGDDRIDDAIAIFRLNVSTFPEFANTHDSLGEALLDSGELEEAAACYRRALELDPESGSTRRQLRRIEERLEEG